jgi:hypothetical protein
LLKEAALKKAFVRLDHGDLHRIVDGWRFVPEMPWGPSMTIEQQILQEIVAICTGILPDPIVAATI